MGAAGAVAAAAASAAGVAGAVLATDVLVLYARRDGTGSMCLCSTSSRKREEGGFHRRTFSTVSLCLSGPEKAPKDPQREHAPAHSRFTQSWEDPPSCARPAFKFSKEETRSRGESQRHPLRGHASVHVPLGAPVLVSVENIQSRGNRVGRKRTGGTDCVARRRDNCERTVSRSRLHEALRRRPMLCSGGHAQQVSYTYGVHGAW